jgi:hypothetical protein
VPVRELRALQIVPQHERFGARRIQKKSVALWLLGVPVVLIVLLNVTGMLGH